MVQRCLALACLAAAAGCHAGGWPVLPTTIEAAPLPEGPRQTITVELPRLDLPPSSPPSLYRYLTAEECRRRACQATPLADVLAAPADWPGPRRLKHGDGEIWNWLRAYAADELRNRHIAEALSDFYRLAAAEGQYDRLRQAEQLLQDQAQTLEKAVQQGVRSAQDLLTVQRQLLEVRSRLAQVESLRIGLNAALAERLGLPSADPPLWPVVKLQVDPRDVAGEAAVDLALTYRPDLNLLRLLVQVDGRSLAQAEGLLQAIHPLLSTGPAPTPLQTLLAELRKAPTLWEERGRSLVEAVLQARQRQVTAEVRAAIAARQGQRTVAAARQSQVEFWRQQLAELEKRQAAGQAVTAELLAARLERLQAEAALLQAVADWHRADVQLRQALGLLVRE
jgi:hypothetical protein